MLLDTISLHLVRMSGLVIVYLQQPFDTVQIGRVEKDVSTVTLWMLTGLSRPLCVHECCLCGAETPLRGFLSGVTLPVQCTCRCCYLPAEEPNCRLGGDPFGQHHVVH
jgi:hypothetical protein